MPVPQIGLLEAFAIGIPVGIAGFTVQRRIIRRRLARSPNQRPPARKTDFGPREEAQTDPGDGNPSAVDVTSPAPAPVPITKPSRTRPKKAVAGTANQAASGTSVKAFVSPAKRAAVAAAAKATEDAAAAAALAAVPTPAAPPTPEAAPVEASKPVPVVSPSKPLLTRETSLAAALDAVVDFVDGAARRARAETCAAELARLVPRARRGPALVAFAAAVASGTAPGELQDLAENVGLELAGDLLAVRREITRLN